MPKRTAYRISWSQEAQVYELSRPTGAVEHLDIHNVAWLESITSFAFQSRTGIHYTARREQVRKNGPYWYGYRFFRGRTHKRYLGRTSDLSLARLEDVAQQLYQSIPFHTDKVAPSSPLAASEPLLMSRFHPPRLPLALVERSSLFARLDTWQAYQCTLVWAPAGFGKTTLINAWLGKRPLPTTWVTLEENDNDPIHFWRSLICACQYRQQEIGQTALGLLLSMYQPPFVPIPLQSILTDFLNDLTTQECAGIVVLDAYHLITEPRVHESMTFFLEHLPPRYHVILLTRNEPPLPLVRWRGRGIVQDFSPADLRFSQAETAAFLRQITGSPPSASVVTQVETLLQGWVAGLHLLSLAGQGTSMNVEQYLDRLHRWQFHGSYHHQVLDYFVREILETQPEPLQRFLLQTSVLPRLSGPLCDDVLERQDSTTLLEMLERAGLFLEALDDVESWFRYHSLWASVLRTEARRCLGDEALSTLMYQASIWYEQHGLPEEAIDMALRSQESERAAALIERLGESGQRYELSILKGWIDQLPNTVVEAHPALCLYMSITLQFQKEQTIPSQEERQRMDALLQKAEEAWLSQGKRAWVGVVFAFRALCILLANDSRQKESVAQATKALTFFADDHSRIEGLPAGAWEWYTISLGIVGSDALHQGCFDEAQQHLLEALALNQRMPGSQFLSEIYLRLGTICVSMGQLSRASEYFRQVLDLDRSQDNSEDSARAFLGLAQLSLEWNDLKAAEHYCNQAQTLAQGASAHLKYTQALLCLAQGQITTALCQLATLLAHLYVTSNIEEKDLIPEALLLQTRLHLVVEDHAAAENNLTRLHVLRETLSFIQQTMCDILQARLRLALGETTFAISQLERLLVVVQEKRYARGQIEIQLLLAYAYATCKQPDASQQRLRQTLSQAQHEGFRLLFLLEGVSLVRLLRSQLPHMREKVLRTYGQSLLKSLMTPPAATSFILERLPFEPLSPQEQRVLQLLVAGYTNQEMANELVISINTIKDHIKHLYHKLGVNTRLQAYEVGQHLLK